MGINWGDIDWGGLLNAGLNLYGSKQNAGSNQQAANTYAQQTKFNPYNIVSGNSGVLFNGNSALGSLSQPYQNIQNQLTGGAGSLLGGAPSLFQNGGINPFLQGSFDQYNADAPQAGQNLGNQFNDSAKSFLGGLGSFDPNQAAGDYTSLLRGQAQPGNQRAAEGLAQGLFNTGRLGSTGGANMFGELINQQNQQDLGFQLAGRQYSGQEQSRLAGLAGQQGQLGNQFNNDAFMQTNARAQARFQNAMQLFGSGQQNAHNQLGAGLGLLQGSQGLDQDLLRAIQTGGYLGGASSSANSAAYNPSMQANVAGNNASSAGWLGLAQSLGLPDMFGSALSKMFGGSGGSSGGSPSMTNPGVDQNNIPTNFNFNDPTDPQYAFSGAGGQATTGNGLLNSMFGGNYDFLGGQANIPNGLQNLDYTGSLNSYADSILGKNLAGGGSPINGQNLTSGLGLLQGLSSGGTKGYGQAVASGASLASNLGLISGQTGNIAGLIGNAASGNYINAAKSAMGLLGSSGSGAAAGGATGAAASGASSAAGTGASAGGSGAASGVGGVGGALSAAVPLFLATQLATGLTQGNTDVRSQLLPGASSSATAAINPVLFGPNGPGKYMQGTGAPNSPLELVLKNGKVLNQQQYQKLLDPYIQNYVQNVKHPGKAAEAAKGLSASTLKMIEQFQQG